jgi:hypothetical protein
MISKPPYSSRPPESNPEKKRGLVDDFLREFVRTKRDKKMLKSFLQYENGQFTLFLLEKFRLKYGEDFNLMVARVDELTQAYGCSSDAVRRLLLQRLKEEDLSDGPESVDAHAQTVPASQLMPHLKAQDPEWPQKDQLPDD